MPDADWPSEPRASDRDDDREAIPRDARQDLAELQARVERLLDPSNITLTSSSAMESAAQASVTTSPTVRPNVAEEAPPVAFSRRDAGSSDLAARLREMEGAERTRPPGPGATGASQGPASGPSFDELRRAITDELPDDGDDDEGDPYRDVEHLETTLAGDDDPFDPSYEDDETEEAEAIDAHAYRTRVRIVVLIQVFTAIACGLLALLHVTGTI
ncbi:MAG: hypothetical protein PVI35_08165 [Acidimicrobiia bacterium]|jgi:hypothetical protein